MYTGGRQCLDTGGSAVKPKLILAARSVVLLAAVACSAVAFAAVAPRAQAAPPGATPATPAPRSAPGTFLWQKIWSTSAPASSPYTFRVATAPTGDVFVAAAIDQPATGGDIVIIRYTSAGARKWVRYFAAPGDQPLREIIADRYGNVILCGRTPGSAKMLDGLVVKYSRAGTRLWTRRLGSTTGDSDIRDIAVDRDRNVYVTGYTHEADPSYEWATLKYSPGGKLLWKRVVSDGTTRFESGEALAVGPDGRVYVAGVTAEAGDAAQDMCVVRYSAAGHRDWTRTQGIPFMDDWAADIAVRASGVCVVGELPDATRIYGVLWKLTRGGVSSPTVMDGVGEPANVQYKYRLAGLDDAGNLFAAGTARTFTSFMFFVRRVRPDGTKDHAFGAGGNGDSEATGLAVTAGGRVYASGTIDSTQSGQGRPGDGIGQRLDDALQPHVERSGFGRRSRRRRGPRRRRLLRRRRDGCRLAAAQVRPLGGAGSSPMRRRQAREPALP